MRPSKPNRAGKDFAPRGRRVTGCVLAMLATALALTAAMGVGGAALTATQAAGAQQEAEFDPLKAEKNLEVGKYYLRRGNYDAAIDRLKDSIRYKSNYAEPHRLLGEAYEKKGDREEAVRYYKKYLEILPSAEDVEKVRKRIEKLAEKIEARKRQRPTP